MDCPAPSKHHFSLHLDHDHATGHFRGFLCESCNLALDETHFDLLDCEGWLTILMPIMRNIVNYQIPHHDR